MKSPICVTNICVTSRKQTASFSIAGLMLAIAPLWLMLAAANTSAYAQTSDNVSNASATTTPAPADWTQFLRDNMQRWNPYETVLGVGNVGGLQLKWKSIPIGSRVDNNDLESSPAVVNGVVYVGSDSNGSVYALNASTGAQLWSFATGSSLLASPAVANGVVYVEQYGGSNLYALDASTGAQLWSDNIGSSVSSPAVVNGVVYVGGGDNVYALNASTGAELWSYATGDWVWSSPAVVNGVVYVGSFDNNVYALNASTGAKLWSYTTGGAIYFSSPTVANGVVYVGSDDQNVYALNASTGAKLWSYTTGGYVQSSPAVANGVVYVGSYDQNFYALNASTGAKLWSYDTGSPMDTSPAVANGVVYVESSYNLYALNASTGAKLWSYTPGGYVWPSPAVVNGVVYFNAFDASGQLHVYAFGLVQPADLYLRVDAEPTPYVNGQLLTYTFRVWNLGPNNADYEVLTTQIPYPFVFDYIRISGTPGLGTCTHPAYGTPAYGNAGIIVCHENSAMAPNTTWTVRLTVELPPEIEIVPGSVITESGTVTAENPDPNLANNTATVSITVQ